MEREIQADGNIEAKGRNGIFKVNSARVWRFSPRTKDTPPLDSRDYLLQSEVMIEIFSKRRDGAPPIRLQGPAEDIQLFVMELANSVNAVIYGTVPPAITREQLRPVNDACNSAIKGSHS
jgi:hypothetical protein